MLSDFDDQNLLTCFLLCFLTDSALPATLQQRIAHKRGYLVPLNSQIILSCPFETPFYKWTRPDAPTQFFDETKNLTLIADSFDMTGRYQCSAVNGFGNTLAEMAVRVVGRFQWRRSCVSWKQWGCQCPNWLDWCRFIAGIGSRIFGVKLIWVSRFK